jgi:hypothetical protein
MRDHIFIHVSKTGGTSIRVALKKLGSLYNVRVPHQMVKEWIDDIGEEEYSKKFTFAFVRNPWDRMASLFLHRYLMKKGDILPESIKKEREKFDAWLEDIYFGVTRKLIMPKRRVRYYTNQYNMISKLDGSIGVSYLGRFETLHADWQNICEQLGICSVLPFVNRSIRRDYFHYYTKHGIEIVAELFDKDIEMFGYKFEKTSKRELTFQKDLKEKRIRLKQVGKL